MEKIGINFKKFKIIFRHLFQKFLDARDNGIKIYDRDLQKWILKKVELQKNVETFTASSLWATILKIKIKFFHKGL